MIERAVKNLYQNINADSLDERISMLKAKLALLERDEAAEAQAYSNYALAYAA